MRGEIEIVRMSAYFSTSLSSVGPGLDAIVKWGSPDRVSSTSRSVPQLGQHASISRNSSLSGRWAPARDNGDARSALWSFQSAPGGENVSPHHVHWVAPPRWLQVFADSQPRPWYIGTSCRFYDRATRPLRADLKTPGSRRRRVDAAGGDVQHHPVDIAGGANRDQALVNVPQNRPGIAIDRVAVAATAHEPDVLDISRFERNVAPGLGDPRLSRVSSRLSGNSSTLPLRKVM